jgi:PAS domain S-box-containing protein
MENKLRKEAESLLEKKFKTEDLQKKSLEELVHELKVHQIELELQNEELLKAQEKLLSSQQKYFELFDLAPVAYLIVDKNTTILDLNLTASNLLHSDRNLIVNRKFDSFIHPDYQDLFYFFFNGLKKNAHETNHESCLKINQQDVYIRIACNVVKSESNPNDQLIRLTLIDITTEKLAVTELKTVKERLELSLLAGNVAWWVWDYPSQTVYYDRKKAEMLGYEDGRMTQNVYEITAMIHPDDYKATMDNMRAHIEGRIPQYQLEYRLKTKQGTYKWFFDQGSVTERDKDGKPLKLCGVVIDITEKKIAELQHLASEKRFRQFAALLPQVVCELDGEFNILYINKFGENLFGLKETGKYNLFEFLDKTNRLRVQKSFNDLINKSETKDPGLQITFKDAKGNDINLFTYASFEIEKNEIKTIRAIGIDLSERIKLEQNLNALNEELNIQKNQLENFNRILEDKVSEEVEKNRVKDQLMSLQARQAAMGEMVGHIAHQWKQPLNTLNLIILDIQDAYQYGELNEEYINKSVHTGKKVIEHMSQTIDDFRNFFKPLKEKKTFNVKQQVDTALSFIRATVETAGIKLENNIKEEFFAKGFPNEFSQVVINIVGNAREAILENGKITDPVIRIDSKKNGNNGSICFYNNGGPIPDNVLSHIFEPYFTTKDDNKGTGIGLYLVKTIIHQNMNGEITLKNHSDGVEFEIVLPLLS